MARVICVLLALYAGGLFAQVMDGLPDPTYRILYSKKIVNAGPVLAFNGSLLGVADDKRIQLINVETGAAVPMSFKGTGINPDSALPVLVYQGGLYVAQGDKLFFLSSAPPKMVWQASGNIRWVERKASEAVLISKAGEVAVLEGGKVSVVERSPTADATAVLGGIEVRDATAAGSWIKLYSGTQLKASCTIPGVKLYRATMSQDGSRVYGLISNRGNDQYEKFAAFECGSGREIFRKSVLQDLLSAPLAKGRDNSRLMQVSAYGAGNACGDEICWTLITSDSAQGVDGVSGVYCANQKTGEPSWQHGVSMGKSTKRVSSALCRGNRLVISQNFPPYLGTRTVPDTVDQMTSLLDDSGKDVLKGLIRSDAFISNPTVKPVVANGRIAFLDSDDNLLVFGK
jgi:outer membrane protein assembly factor BamB